MTKTLASTQWKCDSISNAAAFNQPEQFKDLIENKFHDDFVEHKKEEDRVKFVRQLLFAKKRTFKNFINNNSNIMRRSI